MAPRKKVTKKRERKTSFREEITKELSPEEKKLIKITVADVFSLINAFLGFFAIVAIIRFENGYTIAAFAMILGVIFDFLDGKVARYRNECGEFGKNIDSFADVITFGVAPAFFLSQFLTGIIVFVPFLIVLGGIYRLARFNLINAGNYFMGMPITCNGLIIPVLYLSGVVTAEVAVLASMVIFILMVSTLKIKKFI